MIVYGDAVTVLRPQELLQTLRDGLAAISETMPRLEWHGALVSAFITAGELFQGVADAAFEQQGEDGAFEGREALEELLLTLAGAVLRSWRGNPPALDPALLDQLEKMAWPPAIRVRQPEGYSFYALYPECYLEAAAALSGPVTVIGVRSIGTGLAALVAAASGAARFFTIRPVGHPFARSLRISARLADEILQNPAATFAIVDEGPGLSGSSFGAVADWLEANGVPATQIVFLPSHDGDLGPMASAAHRHRWQSARRHTVSFDACFRDRLPVASWFADLVGTGSVEDISGGGWRRHRYADPSDWPPVHAQQERRKFLLRGATGTFLLKFAGLGPDAAGKFERARALHLAGFTPEPIALRHGFLLEAWEEDAVPLACAERPTLERLAAYLAFRAEAFPAPAPRASLDELVGMLMHNGREELGSDFQPLDEALLDRLPALAAAVRPVNIDGRPHRWEWLRRSDGQVIKTDTLDHAGAHDLIGPQDIAWDIAGAIVEFDMSGQEADRLRRLIGEAPLRRDLTALLIPCYLAFQLGYWRFAAGADPDDGRAERQIDWYRQRLRAFAQTAPTAVLTHA